MNLSDEVLKRRAAGLEWLLFDVDGVLTDGTLIYTWRGEQVKFFNARDGMGFYLARKAGLKIGLLSGRRSRPLERRAADLKFDEVMLGSKDKQADFEYFLEKHETTPGRVSFMGDDLPDLPVLGRCALSFAPADAAPEVLDMVHVTVSKPGGAGAAREMIETVLKARGSWDEILAHYSLGE